MTLSKSKGMVSADAYATAADFERIFTDHMSGLYLLSFLLAGARGRQRQYSRLASKNAREESRIQGVGAFVGSTFYHWSANRMVGPQQNSKNGVQSSAVARAIERLPLALQAEASSIIELAPLQRFVFVMSFLERYSDHDCFILLSCARRDLATARARHCSS